MRAEAKSLKKELGHNLTKDDQKNLSNTTKMSKYEQQALLMPYEGTFADFNDRVIQFGYLVLFAPAYPLAPFLSFLNNIVEIRLGGYKMCHGFQRPKWKVRTSIGSWNGMLQILGFLAVITNCLMVSFVGSEMATISNLYVDKDQEACHRHSGECNSFSQPLLPYHVCMTM